MDFPLELNDHKITLRLKDGCRETYLPQRYYPFLTNDRSLTIEWDNFSKDIFVDKYLVRVFEVKDWARNVERNDILERFKTFKDEDIAVNLSVKDMENYCSYQGKHILSARVHDAMSIHPEDISDSKTKLMRAPYYPWSRRNSSTQIFKLQKKQLKALNPKDKKSLCKRVYSKDCEEFKYTHYESSSVTWTGVFETMGGPLEYVRNIIHPGENINLSSRYFKWSNKVHRLGYRGAWDEEEFGDKNFDFSKHGVSEKIRSFEIGFRCMRYK